MRTVASPIFRIHNMNGMLNEMISIEYRTCVKSCVLLDVRKLLESAIAVGAFIGFFSSVNTDVLD